MDDLIVQMSTSEVKFPYGVVLPYAGRISKDDKKTLSRSGWYLCDGKAVSRKLPAFAVIGSIYGTGDNVNTFNVPDYRGLFLRGVDDPTGSSSANRDPDVLSRYGTNSGSDKQSVGSVQDDAISEHAHGINNAKSAHHSPPAGHPHGYKEGSHGTSIYGTGGVNEPTRISSETRPKNIYINYIIYLGRK